MTHINPAIVDDPLASAGPGSTVISSATPVTPKPAFPPPVASPTQRGREAIRFDFNLGARLSLPPRASGQWRVRLTDLDTGNTLFQSENQGAFVNSSKRWFVRFGVEVWSLDRAGTPTLVMDHRFDARDQNVLVQVPVGTLGDILAWFPSAVRFAEVHGCRLTCAMSALIIPLLKDAYPAIRFVTPEAVTEEKLVDTFYATYSIGLFFDDEAFDWQPVDFRHVGLHRTAGYILGIGPVEDQPRFVLPDETRPIPEPYVCIAVQASTQAKSWTNPHGWREVVHHLKKSGFRVICIDQKPVNGSGMVWTHIPHGAEDETGDRPLTERARWLRHAHAFVGLSSGLAWLAWGANCPVVMISGFTHPDNEFATPYRVINWHACNSCWNDMRIRFNHKDFLWCPRHAGTPRQFECTSLITAEQVKQTMARIPGFEVVPKTR